jgi:hypothetical protein
MFEQKGVKNAQTSTNSNQQNCMLLRFYFDLDRRVLFVNMVPPLYHRWTQKVVKMHKKHFDTLIAEDRSQSTTASGMRNTLDHVVFLNRNKKKSSLKALSPKDVLIQNRITFKVAIPHQTHAHNLKLVPSLHSKEDVILRLQNKRDEQQYMKNCLKKVLKFRVGHAHQTWLNSRVEKLH